MVTEKSVRDHFRLFTAEGGNEAFYAKVSPNCKFTVTGRGNPLHGEYSGKADFFARYMGPLGKTFAGGVLHRRVKNVVVAEGGNGATVEWVAEWTGTKSDKAYVVELCWVCEFEGDVISSIIIYADSAVIQEIFSENK
jgi:ketosteroid isomerase-like protein